MQFSHSECKAILFDLDGTLVDTAPDLVYALNVVRQENNLPPIPLKEIRHCVSYGSKALICEGFSIEPTHENFETHRQRLLSVYEQNVCNQSTVFPQMNELIHHLMFHNIPWGIVTNKPTRFTLPLIKKLGWSAKANCVVCGDTTQHLKPHPAPLLHASAELNIEPSHCLFIGDSVNDINAGKSAGMKTVTALYGYIAPDDDPQHWQADHTINTSEELYHWITR